ncbi:hypothetical protein O6H91_01G098600 [Diphasiastrum complanatum]|uniref:Uncharacterized protein n=1 Tax=Diphasiastrum complanatum TaxID=34168 RepID=A0ACC2ETJ1_DIPCM|nr:hypothetical protein O6H91_Y462900 [Diphasiastrum complanatum]KAJ7569879.1 hypothetical protein O6H91_01G098600 [Diphasiastrum complanatum]
MARSISEVDPCILCRGSSSRVFAELITVSSQMIGSDEAADTQYSFHFNLLIRKMCNLMDWGCHDSLSPNSPFEIASSSKQRSCDLISKLSSNRPVIQRCISRLPGRTPVLPKRVINLRLEESQQLRDYIMESLHPQGDVNLPSSCVYDATTGDQQLTSKPWPPSPLGFQMSSCITGQ